MSKSLGGTAEMQVARGTRAQPAVDQRGSLPNVFVARVQRTAQGLRLRVARDTSGFGHPKAAGGTARGRPTIPSVLPTDSRSRHRLRSGAGPSPPPTGQPSSPAPAAYRLFPSRDVYSAGDSRSSPSRISTAWRPRERNCPSCPSRHSFRVQQLERFRKNRHNAVLNLPTTPCASAPRSRVSCSSRHYRAVPARCRRRPDRREHPAPDADGPRHGAAATPVDNGSARLRGSHGLGS